VRGIDPFQARLTFAIGRHTLIDVSQVLRLPPRGDSTRVTPQRLEELHRWLKESGVPIEDGPEARARMDELSGLYDPYVTALSEHLLMPLPSWVPPEKARFNWKTTAPGRVHDGAN
jgi:hypothetical protein